MHGFYLQNNSRMSIRGFKENISLHSIRVTSEMTIFNLTDEDEGKYECFIKTSREYKTKSKNIILHG